MSFSPGFLFVELIPSGIGMVLFMYGKKQVRVPHMIAGAALLVYPYFVSTVTPLVLIGLAIVAALWIAVRQGW